MDGLFKRMDVVSYNVSDWQRAKKFYCDTLGLPVAGFVSDEVGWMELGDQDGTHLALNKWAGPGAMPNGGGGATAVFSVEDAYQAVTEPRKRWVKCDDVIAIPQMVTYASFYDPDGNRLQVAGPPPKE